MSAGRRGRGVPAVIAGLLMASGLVRLGSGGAEVIAREVGELADAASAAGSLTGECAPPPELAPILTRLQERESEIAATEARLADRARTLEIAREEVAAQLGRLEEAEAALRRTLSLAEDAGRKDLDQLTSVYENMDVDKAAGLFGSMAPEFAAGFLGRMRPAKAAEIMAGLENDDAYAISVILAGRNADVPTE